MNFQKTETSPGKVEVYTWIGGKRYNEVRGEARLGVDGVWIVEAYHEVIGEWNRIGTISVGPDDVEDVVGRLERLQTAIDAL